MPKFWLFGKTDSTSLDENVPILVSKEELNNEKAEPEELKASAPLSKELNDKAGGDVPVSKGILLSDASSSTTYYGVSLPYLFHFTHYFEEQQTVFVDKAEALSVVKKFKGARFKAFSTIADARNYSLNHFSEQLYESPSRDCDPSSPSISDKNTEGNNYVGEKSVPYKAPKSQETVKLRKAIETGDIKFVFDTVWSNPRYLISSGDTPTILMEGFRYNALHVAAKFKQPVICQLLLDTIGNPEFMELLYDDDSEIVRSQRIEYLIDLYLNTPDKRACETPLHFASKFGCPEAVEILVSHPACDTNRKNKEGKIAKEIICERCPASSLELKAQMEEAFNGQFFVPVFRSEDNSSQPLIGEPCLHEYLKKCSPSKPLNSDLTIMAVAGPMSPKQAKQFYKHWKTPPAHRYGIQEVKQLSQIRLSDREKGLERIGRTLAHSWKAKWMEYWPALDTWCDLSSFEGLKLLEDHLRQLYQKETFRDSYINCRKTWRRTRLENDGKSNTVVNESEDVDVSKESSDVCQDHSEEKQETVEEYLIADPSGNDSSLSCNSICSSNSSGGITKLCLELDKFHLSDSDSSCLMSPEMPVRKETKASDDSPEPSFYFSNAESEREPQKSGDDICLKMDDCFLKNHNLRHNMKKDSDKNENEIKFHNAYRESGSDKFISIVTSIIKCLRSFFLELAMNFEFGQSEKSSIHSLLKEDILPIMKYLTDMNFNNESDVNFIHCDIANEICEQIKCSLTENEVLLISRCLYSYLDLNNTCANNTYASSDEEEIDFQNDIRFNYSRFKMTNKIQWQHLKCILKFLVLKLNLENLTEEYCCQCHWQQNAAQNPFAVSACRKNIFSERNAKCNKEVSKSCNFSVPVSIKDANEDDDLDFFTPPSSPIHSSDEEALTPDEGLEIYVRGLFPSKADVDMLRALDDAQLDPVHFPHVCRWKHLMESKSNERSACYQTPVERKLSNSDKEICRILSSPPPRLSYDAEQLYGHSTPLSPSTKTIRHFDDIRCNLSELY